MTSHTHKREKLSAVRTSHSEALAEVVCSWLFVNVTILTNIGPPGPKIWLRPSLRGPLFDDLASPLGGLVFAKVSSNLLPKITSHTHQRENFSAVRTSHSEALA